VMARLRFVRSAVDRKGAAGQAVDTQGMTEETLAPQRCYAWYSKSKKQCTQVQTEARSLVRNVRKGIA
jgi:hypothetical protein